MKPPNAEQVEAYVAQYKALNDGRVHDIGEIMKLGDDPRIQVDRDYVGLFYSYPYLIELSRISCVASLLWWVHHLTGKNWMTSEAVHLFIEKVCAAKGFQMYVPDE